MSVTQRRSGRAAEGSDVSSNCGQTLNRVDASKKGSEARAPLNPPPRSLAAFELFVNRAGRVGLVALVPFLGIGFALPRVLEIRRNSPLCLRPELFHPRGLLIPCSGTQMESNVDLSTEWGHFLFSLWVGIQFVFNFAQACFREPGFVETASKESVRYDPVFARGKNGRPEALTTFVPRWCPDCHTWKPPRAHHNRKMGRCVLRLDHYCVTVENVVGVRNHGYFVLMVGFGCLGLFYALFMICSIIPLVWTPFWELRDRIGNIGRGNIGRSRRVSRQDGWSLWPSSSFYAFNTIVGGELLIYFMAEAIALVMIFPLVQNVLIASKGITVLESMSFFGDKLDRAILNKNKSGRFSLGAFSRGSRWGNLRVLLGPSWMFRLILPVPGRADEQEEESPIVTDEVAEKLRNLCSLSDGDADGDPSSGG